MVHVQEIVAGRYEVLGVLGRGGMGAVFRATDHVLDRTVALKVLPVEFADDPVLVTRFEREARAAAALSHPNIVAVYDTGQEGGTRFIVMECVPGLSLAQLLRRRGRLPPQEAVAIAGQIAAALSAAHGAGIIHRDIKPGNVMVDDAGTVKVLDFGIARAAAGTSLTRTATILGSAAYMAPEVTRGQPADTRSDIYALGCVLYEMLTGRPPFTGELAAAIMHQHNTAPPRPPRELAPDTRAGLDALVMRMLAKRPADRPQSADELGPALAASLAAAPTARTAPFAPTAPTTVYPARRTSRTAFVLAAVAALLLAGLAVALLSGGGSGHTGSSTGGAPKTTSAHRTAVRTTTARTTPPQTTSTPPPSAPPTTVAGAAANLTGLATRDLQSRGIDQQAAQQIQSHLQDVLNSYGTGNTGDALHKVDDLSNQISQLSQHGDITPSALPAIQTAVGDLRLALERSAPITPTTPQPPGGPHPGGPPGHDKPGKPGKD